jgi:hypothetical protein
MANKPCVSCVCLYQCKNQCVEIKTEGRFGETETEKARTETPSSPGLARRLDQSLAETVPWQHRTAETSQPPTMPPSRPDIQPSAATKEANQAPTPAVNGTKGTERKEKEHEIGFDEDNGLPAYALTATETCYGLSATNGHLAAGLFLIATGTGRFS